MTPAAAEAVYFAGPPRWERGELLSHLRRLLAQRVEQAYVFGSYGRGTADADSDVDLILVVPTQAPWPRRAEAFADLWDQLGPVDLLVYTPREWLEMSASQHPFLEATAGERVGVFE
ncbi:MAG: nucleotidyltransferase domain-containing protein [Proteobacteria bacterium]|nr:nucleotidyltransferase domain-containing protein [Pseudomonadota bacterium]